METQNFFSTAEDKFWEIQGFLESHASHQLDLSGVEEYLATNGRELLRHLLTAHIADRGLGDIGTCVMGADGRAHPHKRIRSRTVKTLFGPLVIHRLGYAPRWGDSLFPLDAMLNLPTSNISYTLQKHLMLEVVKGSFHDALDTIVRWTGVTISSAQAHALIQEAAQDFTRFYRTRSAQEQVVARALPLLVLTADGKGVLVRMKDLRTATKRQAAAQAPLLPGEEPPTRRPHVRRMATVASVYEVARFPRTPEDIVTAFFATIPPDKRRQRPRPTAKRLWASLKHANATVITTIFEEAMRRDAAHTKDWVVLVDGDPNQIKTFERIAHARQVSLTIICDIVHVLGYLWKAGKVLQDKAHVTLWVRDKLTRILQGHSGRVAAGMRRSATCQHLSSSARKPVDACARYLRNHAPYLAYQDYLTRGYPIATGVIEGACAHFVKDRMELTGARWSLEGAEAVLKLRAITLSGDFSTYWTFYEQQQYQRNHALLYQNPPNPGQEENTS